MDWLNVYQYMFAGGLGQRSNGAFKGIQGYSKLYMGSHMKDYKKVADLTTDLPVRMTLNLGQYQIQQQAL